MKVFLQNDDSASLVMYNYNLIPQNLKKISTTEPQMKFAGAYKNKLASSVMAKAISMSRSSGHARQTYGESLCGPQAYR